MNVSIKPSYLAVFAAAIFAVLWLNTVFNGDYEKPKKGSWEAEIQNYQDSILAVRRQKDSLTRLLIELNTKDSTLKDQRDEIKAQRFGTRVAVDTASIDSLYSYLTNRYGDSGIDLRTEIRRDRNGSQVIRIVSGRIKDYR